jgi:hypothetical protein
MKHSGTARDESGLRLRQLASAAALSAILLGSAPLAAAAAPHASITHVPRPRRVTADAQEPQKPNTHAKAKSQAKKSPGTASVPRHTAHRRHHTPQPQSLPVEMKRAEAEHSPLHPQTAAQGPASRSNEELQRAIDADAAQTAAAQTAGQTAAAQPTIAELSHPSHEELAEAAAQPVVLPGLYRNGRLIVPAPLKGSHDILVHQNLMADSEGLERIVDDGDLARLRASHDLVNFPESASLRLNPELPTDRRCARAWTVRFATDIAKQYYARFHQPLQVNSAARTIAYQLHLQRTNGNAVGVGGDIASPHLTGQAIDFGKSGMSIAQIAWMRAYLKPLMDAGKLDVEEEFQQACFHISVYRSYLPAVKRLAKTDVAQLR